MAALTSDQIVTIRRKVGSAPDDAALQVIYDRTGSLTDLVREVLEIRLADLERSPASFAVPGEYSQDTTANIKALTATLAGLGDLDNPTPADDGAPGMERVSMVAPVCNSTR